MISSSFMFTNSVFLYTPLEQFDEVIWISNYLFQSIDSSFFSVSESEFSAVDSYSNASTSTNTFSSLETGSGFFLMLLLLGLFGHFSTFIFKRVGSVESESAMSNSLTFSPIALLAMIHLFTGSLFTFWFSDFFFPREMISSTGTSYIQHIFLPQMNIAFSLDESSITFFLAFFLLGGGESEDEEDSFLTAGSDLEIVEEIVAPLFVANLGKDIQENGSLYLKVCSIFSFVLMSNLSGSIPYGDTATSSLMLTFWVAFAVFGSLMTLSMRKHGMNYFFSLFSPSGCPLPLMFLLIPIEFLSYSFRVVSLSVRLFANSSAGHTLSKVLIGFSYVSFTLGEGYAVAAFLPALVVFVLIFLESAVAGIQAYIFTILICIYLKDLYVAH